MLHTVNKSPFTNNALEECARFLAEGSVVLLIEDGVYAAKAGSSFEGRLKEIMGKNEVCALEADLKARGIGSTVDGVRTINYDGFVELVEQHRMTAWV